MKLGEKIRILRKKEGMSQDELCFKLGEILNCSISRQSISDWENDKVEPKLENVKILAKIFNVSYDILLDENIELGPNGEVKNKINKEVNALFRLPLGFYHYEYVSKVKINNLPLVHVNVGMGLYKAKGIIAIGNISFGLISVGLVSLGLISFGLLAIGLISLACFTFGLLMSMGAISAGLFSLGAISIGYVSLGAIAIGRYSIGALAIASDIGLGAKAYGKVSFGSIEGEFIFTKIEIENLIKEKLPNTSKCIVNLFKIFGK